MAKPEYYTSNLLFLLIGNYMFFWFGQHLFQSFILMQQKIKYIGVLKLAGCIINLVLNFFLISRWSYIGAAISTLVAQFVIFCLIIYTIGVHALKGTRYLYFLIVMNGILLLNFFCLSSLSPTINIREIVIKLIIVTALGGFIAHKYGLFKKVFTKITG